MKGRVSSFQFILLVALLVALGVIILGSLANHNDHKYTKSHNTSCTRGLLILNDADSHTCCDIEKSWVCSASFDILNRIMSSATWAFVIPIIPYLLNVITQTGSITGKFKRLIVYTFIFAFRTILLYLIPMYIQDALQDTSENDTLLCWCKEFVSSKRCRLLFDFSDHIVLNLVQYILPCVLEIHYCWYNYSHSSQDIEARQKQGFILPPFRSNMASYLVTIVALVIIGFNLRSILFTSMFFHTHAENAVGFLIAALLAYRPLQRKDVATFWTTHILTS
mmetsp:Transcript_18834/g.31530  ORF Transcript_18834/g.31530 Transcript_18834/m.31530 type:complete len:279 (-) Transcript_18834:167-1003(-)